MSRPRSGRPRSAVVHDKILNATRALLAESGYAGVSMDKVAAAAGVGTQTVYRRWPSKGPLVAEAVLQALAAADASVPDSGNIVEDLEIWLHNYAALAADAESVALVRALTVAAAGDLHDRDILYRQLTGQFHDSLCHRLRAAIDVGQIRADADIVAAADALLGATLYRMLSVTTAEPEAISRYKGLLDALMNGLSNR